MHFQSKFNKIFNICCRILLDIAILLYQQSSKIRFLMERMSNSITVVPLDP